MPARIGLAVFFSMNVMAFTMALWSGETPGPGESPTAIASTLHGLFRHLVLLFSLPVFFLLGLPLAENAWEAARRGIFSTDILLATGVAASFLYSSISVIRDEGPVYFEVGCVVLIMVTLGRWLESSGKLRAGEALDRLARLMPDLSRRLVEREGVEVEESVATVDLAAGDLIRVLPGERIPADGLVESGTAFVDQQVITGESLPELRRGGDAVLAGTLDLDGELRIRATAPGAAGSLARIIELVRSARRAKGPSERLADQVATWFVPVVALTAFVTFAAHARISGFEQALMNSLAVVLIACPCALGLATPLAVWSALGRAAERQVLFRGGDVLEALASVKAIRFDKTGTLTTGEPRVDRVAWDPETPPELALGAARALATTSTHSIASAVARFPCEFEPVEPPIDARGIAGRGIEATLEIGGRPTRALLGSRRFLAENDVEVDPELAAEVDDPAFAERTSTWVAWGGRARACFAFDEEIRISALAALEASRALGLDLAVLTGDHEARGRAFEREVGIPVTAGLLPEQKVDAVRATRGSLGSTAMVGDGVNDAPALAAADVGIAAARGADLSRESAGVCLTSEDLSRIPWAIALSRETMNVVRWNLFWAFGYNIVGVAAAAFGRLDPAFAALLMVGSSAFVIVNSLRIQGRVDGSPVEVATP
ncbi:MAG: cation-translocating P-type ATPase [Isosphaeraceae bacterium]|nr:cation-translocating P-type ATPase [Isosphaeraceae bacterium]